MAQDRKEDELSKVCDLSLHSCLFNNKKGFYMF